MIVRETSESNTGDVLYVIRTAFDSDEEAHLVRDLMGDKSAQPVVSLLTLQEDQPLGHPAYYPRYGFKPAPQPPFM